MSVLAPAFSLDVPGMTTDPSAVAAARRAQGLDRLWICDLTQIWGATCWLYFAFVLDRDSRRCLGWSPHQVPHADLVTDALVQAVATSSRSVVPVVFGRGCRTAQVDFPRSAMSSAADAALCDAFVAALRREFVDQSEVVQAEDHERAWASPAEAKLAIGEWIAECYNRPSPARPLVPAT